MARSGYAETSRQLLGDAHRELDAGDLIQASEKLWGAAAHMVKEFAARRGWPHGSHRNLNETISRLPRETSDPDLLDLFAYAQSLHVNFYEDWQTPDFVERGVTTVEHLVAKLERL